MDVLVLKTSGCFHSYSQSMYLSDSTRNVVGYLFCASVVLLPHEEISSGLPTDSLHPTWKFTYKLRVHFISFSSQHDDFTWRTSRGSRTKFSHRTKDNYRQYACTRESVGPIYFATDVMTLLRFTKLATGWQ